MLKGFEDALERAEALNAALAELTALGARRSRESLDACGLALALDPAPEATLTVPEPRGHVANEAQGSVPGLRSMVRSKAAPDTAWFSWLTVVPPTASPFA